MLIHLVKKAERFIKVINEKMTIESFNTAIVILAAGASKRMGEPKQLLPWGHSTLIEHVIQKAIKVEVKEVSVVLGANYDIINNKIKNYPINIINNIDWKVGLSSSISKAVTHYIRDPKIDTLIFILADQPFIPDDYLNKMLTDFTPNQNQIIASQYEDGKLGIPVLFDRYYFDELLSLNGDFGANHILQNNKSYVNILEASFNCLDIDTKDDYKKAYFGMFKE